MDDCNDKSESLASNNWERRCKSESESVESNSWERMGATVPSDLGQRVAGAKSG